MRTQTEADFSSVAALIGEPSRAAMLSALMNGLALPAGELAELAGISPQTTSAHLQKLLNGQLLAVETHGRHRYYRLKNPDVAAALEALMQLAPNLKPRALRDDALARARTCYDHLAGQLGVRLEVALIHNGWLERRELTYHLTPTGVARLEGFGVDTSAITLEPRFAKACLDWTERRYHVGGLLGRTLTKRFLELGWLAQFKDTRALRLTQVGQGGFEQVFGMRF